MCSNWEQVTPTGYLPPAIHGHAAVLDEAGRIWTFGGLGWGGYFSDLWYLSVLEAARAGWSRVTRVTSVPPARRDHTAVIDAAGQMWIFGGYGGSGRLSAGGAQPDGCRLRAELCKLWK
eukprot:Skav224674  [mRNA]  locus=scaffold4044:155013:155742:- [translate_table: standard]